MEYNKLGIDSSYDGFWEKYLLSTYGDKIKDIVKKASFEFNIKNSNLTDKGIYYLLQKTHVLKYIDSKGNIEPTNKSSFITVILFALFLSEEYNEIIIDKQDLMKNFFVLEGTNLCFNFENYDNKPIIFNPGIQEISYGINKAHVHLNKTNYLFDINHQDFFSSLLYDIESGFIFFYLEKNSNTAYYDRFLLETKQEIEQEIEILRKCKLEIQSVNPFIWDCILRHITYISFTELDGFESSTDPRELRNSLIINMRLNQNMNKMETAAWCANGLYHESKHNQYIDSIFLEIPPYETNEKYKHIFEKERKTVIAPWKDLPRDRTLTQILLGLHAFTPGLYICFQILLKDRKGFLSSWIKDRIELEMRTTNGAISIAILSRIYLNGNGKELLDILIEDYFDYLFPTYYELVDQKIQLN